MLFPAVKRSLLLTALVCYGALAAPGCSKKSSSSVKIAADTLTLRGAVVDISGTALTSADLYLGDAGDPVGAVDADGSYVVALGRSELAVLAGAENLQLFAVAADGSAMTGASTPLPAGARGTHDLAPITVRSPVTITGRVLTMASGLKAEPAVGATIQIGRVRATAGEGGAFKLAGVAAGAAKLTAAAANVAPATLDLTLTAGETRTLADPLVLFPQSGVYGVVTLSDLPPGTDTTGHPYLRRFRVQGQGSAKYFRLNHDKGALGTATWRELTATTATADYDFPGTAAQTLYYQFADAAQKPLGDVMSVVVIIDTLSLSTGFVIGDGSGLITARSVPLHIDVPPLAYRMRIAENTGALEAKPWLEVAPEFLYTFDIGIGCTSGTVNISTVSLTTVGQVDPDCATKGYGTKTLYLQFQDAAGNRGPVHVSTGTMELFPDLRLPGFEIDGGAAVTPNRFVRLDLTVPANAYEMRVFDITTLITGTTIPYYSAGLWTPVQPQFFYMFSSPGLKTLYVQYRTVDLLVSRVYQQMIRVDPFPVQDRSFAINNGAAYAPSRHLTIDLFPPPQATAYRIVDTAVTSSFAGVPYLALVPRSIFSVTTSGVHTLLVQFRNIDGFESYVEQQTIEVAPFAPQTGDLLVNGGAPLTWIPLVTVAVDAPPTARYMAVTEGAAAELNSSAWTDVEPSRQLLLSTGIGTKKIFLRFRTTEGELSAAIERTIFYDPFPFGAAGVHIANGAATTTSLNVTLQLYAPPHHTAFRVSTDPAALLAQPFIEYASTYPFTLPTGTGPVNVYIQYRASTNEISPVYYDDITRL